ncbi:adenylosuccinate lyase [Caldicellulosiruptor bescii]|uniref:Adenylosuccinate lyase n=2 Tax=Caldicellulosiruptor bescii TaxID=31899 RepID=B9MRC6_CALBD|nr:adenylosuccinate lyase [Caldicellulosiruptor bescii]ACM60230.1 adenylosuccinate lyase [Caldicellulosiruptor bescii DSM 6725]PBC87645.1 adenylosuccinate lyase [Caldicellulosiruptor bescii]PBC90578.1 adenylosuccinate lyase [Caldicellulosiruptor bescii]PBD03990.1 adenylosuccinate lyase [Caldicellulosiruptor bescii]PBD06375.1 adenylosuccinate lyase [Caldicellulosiruptor bescii]
MNDIYETPLNSRYASDEMKRLFSNDTRFKLWRKLWIALAEAQKELGLDITDEQIEEMKRYAEDINYEVARQKEKELRHDVMAHIHAFGEQAKKARPIIHLGATSCFVTDNADIIIMYEALKLIRKKLVNCIKVLSDFALKYKDMPTLGFTHFQPAQLTTVGKRAMLWVQDLVMDLEFLEYVMEHTYLRGVKGTTGTQASFMALFDGNEEKVKMLDKLVCKKMGFEKSFPLTSQTYPRKYDFLVLSVLASIAQSSYKFANDIRLLQHLKEIEEPFEKTQVGSSAMAYKRNPMRSERICALARYVMVNIQNPLFTASVQWLERTLDDSANRRISIPEAFLATDSILNLYHNVASGLVVYERMIERHIQQELPFMATENILMEAVKRGGDRQDLHEKIRKYSMEAGRNVKEFGKENNLIELISNDPSFKLSKEEIQAILDPKKFVGRAPSQVQEYYNEYVKPILEKYKDDLNFESQVNI